MRTLCVMAMLFVCHSLVANGCLSSTMGISCHGEYLQPVMTNRLVLFHEQGHLLASFSIVSRVAFQGNTVGQISLKSNHGLGAACAIGLKSGWGNIVLDAKAMRLWTKGDGVSLLFALSLIPEWKVLDNCYLLFPLSIEWQSDIKTYSGALGCKLVLP